MLNIAEGALSALTDIVTRQTELAQQAANGSYSGKQRQALAKEANALRDEYNRIIQTTQFNGRTLLDGKNTDVVIQQGFGVNETLTISLGTKMGRIAGDGTFRLMTTLSASAAGSPYQVAAADFDDNGTFDLAIIPVVSMAALGFDIDGSTILENRGNGSFSPARNAAPGEIPFSLTLNEYIGSDNALDFNGDGFLDILDPGESSDDFAISYGSAGGFKAPLAVLSPYRASEILAQDFNNDGRFDLLLSDFDNNRLTTLINEGGGNFREASVINSNSPGKPMSGDFNGDGLADFVVEDDSNFTFQVYLGRGDGTFVAGTSQSTSLAGRAWLTVADFNNDGVADIAAYDGSFGQLRIFSGNSNSEGRFNNLQAPLDLSEPVLARRTLSELRHNLTRLTQERSVIGASQSRLQSSLALLSSRVVEYNNAKSKITDIDVAEESAKAVRLQILQQVGSSILAQANQQPRLALDLLR